MKLNQEDVQDFCQLDFVRFLAVALTQTETVAPTEAMDQWYHVFLESEARTMVEKEFGRRFIHEPGLCGEALEAAYGRLINCFGEEGWRVADGASGVDDGVPAMCGAATAAMCGASTSAMGGNTTAAMCGAATASMCGATTAAMCGANTAAMCGATTIPAPGATKVIHSNESNVSTDLQHDQTRAQIAVERLRKLLGVLPS